MRKLKAVEATKLTAAEALVTPHNEPDPRLTKQA